jgi:hypothetical protein
MGSIVSFYCGEKDNQALHEYAESIGLSIVPPTLDRPVDTDPVLGPFCFLSVVPKGTLSPYGNPPIKISDATDPVIGFMRAYYKNPYLVLGDIYWSDDVPDYAKQTKPYYQKLAKWIKREWEKYGDFYIGPEARVLLDKGAKMVNALPGQAEIRIDDI